MRAHLEPLVEDSPLPLYPHILGPPHESVQVVLGLGCASNPCIAVHATISVNAELEDHEVCLHHSAEHLHAHVAAHRRSSAASQIGGLQALQVRPSATWHQTEVSALVPVMERLQQHEGSLSRSTVPSSRQQGGTFLIAEGAAATRFLGACDKPRGVSDGARTR